MVAPGKAQSDMEKLIGKNYMELIKIRQLETKREIYIQDRRGKWDVQIIIRSARIELMILKENGRTVIEKGDEHQSLRKSLWHIGDDFLDEDAGIDACHARKRSKHWDKVSDKSHGDRAPAHDFETSWGSFEFKGSRFSD